MALRDGIDTDYDEGDQFEEEMVRYFEFLKMFANVKMFTPQVEFLIKEEETIIQD